MYNHLKNQTSPYLLQHADNPVHWYPWCKEAFEKAKKEEKPIFLSIGCNVFVCPSRLRGVTDKGNHRIKGQNRIGEIKRKGSSLHYRKNIRRSYLGISTYKWANHILCL